MKRKVVNRFQGNAKKALLRWVQCTAAKYATFSCCESTTSQSVWIRRSVLRRQVSWYRSEGLWPQLARWRGLPVGGARHQARPGGHGGGAEAEQQGEPGGRLRARWKRAGHPPPAGSRRWSLPLLMVIPLWSLLIHRFASVVTINVIPSILRSSVCLFGARI